MSGTTHARAAFDDLQREIIRLANDVSGNARDKLLEYSTISASIIEDLEAGRMTLEQAQKASNDIALAVRSSLVTAGYAAQKAVFDAVLAGVATAFKLLVAFA